MRLALQVSFASLQLGAILVGGSVQFEPHFMPRSYLRTTSSLKTDDTRSHSDYPSVFAGADTFQTYWKDLPRIEMPTSTEPDPFSLHYLKSMADYLNLSFDYEEMAYEDLDWYRESFHKSAFWQWMRNLLIVSDALPHRKLVTEDPFYSNKGYVRTVGMLFSNQKLEVLTVCGIDYFFPPLMGFCEDELKELFMWSMEAVRIAPRDMIDRDMLLDFFKFMHFVKPWKARKLPGRTPLVEYSPDLTQALVFRDDFVAGLGVSRHWVTIDWEKPLEAQQGVGFLIDTLAIDESHIDDIIFLEVLCKFVQLSRVEAGCVRTMPLIGNGLLLTMIPDLMGRLGKERAKQTFGTLLERVDLAEIAFNAAEQEGFTVQDFNPTWFGNMVFYSRPDMYSSLRAQTRWLTFAFGPMDETIEPNSGQSLLT